MRNILEKKHVVWIPGGEARQLTVEHAFPVIAKFRGQGKYVWETRVPGAAVEEATSPERLHRTLEEALDDALPGWMDFGLGFERAALLAFNAGLVVSTGIEVAELFDEGESEDAAGQDG